MKKIWEGYANTEISMPHKNFPQTNTRYVFKYFLIRDLIV